MSILGRLKELNDINDLDIPDKYKESILHMVTKLQDYPVVKEIILFGSCARSQVKKNSDIDMALVVEEPISIQDEGDIDYEIRHWDYGLPCDIIFISRGLFNKEVHGETVIRPILREGLILNGLLLKR